MCISSSVTVMLEFNLHQGDSVRRPDSMMHLPPAGVALLHACAPRPLCCPAWPARAYTVSLSQAWPVVSAHAHEYFHITRNGYTGERRTSAITSAPGHGFRLLRSRRTGARGGSTVQCSGPHRTRPARNMYVCMHDCTVVSTWGTLKRPTPGAD